MISEISTDASVIYDDKGMPKCHSYVNRLIFLEVKIGWLVSCVKRPIDIEVI